MKKRDVLGIIFSNMHDEQLSMLTKIRTVGSVPFGGSYRLIDFPLSNMVNSGITKVAVITKSNYQSLLDHLQSGKNWDLARSTGGLIIFPPFGRLQSGRYRSRIEALHGIIQFLSRSKEKYVVMADCDVVYNINYDGIVEHHITTGADVTFGVKVGKLPSGKAERMVFSAGRNGRVKEILISPDTNRKVKYSINLFVMEREKLALIINDAMARGNTDLFRDIFQRGVDALKEYIYEVEEEALVIGDMQSYVASNMRLLDRETRDMIFAPSRPVYTKQRGEMPARYGEEAAVINSMIADGCVIEGTVENSVIFRDVKIGRGAKVKNCVIMQSTVIGDDCSIEYVVSDKNAVFSPACRAIGFSSNPMFVEKGGVAE